MQPYEMHSSRSLKLRRLVVRLILHSFELPNETLSPIPRVSSGIGYLLVDSALRIDRTDNI